MLTIDHEPDCEPTVFLMDMRAQGKGFDAFYQRAIDKGVKFVRSRPSYIKEDPLTGDLLISWEDEAGKMHETRYDMVVLSAGLEPARKAQEAAGHVGVALNRHGFCELHEFNPLETSRKGVFVVGPFGEPKDIPDSVAQASAAAAQVMTGLADSRHTLTVDKEYPAEKNVVGVEPRVGVFVCHCGSNIAGVIEVESVAEYAKQLPGVAFATDTMYTCSATASRSSARPSRSTTSTASWSPAARRARTSRSSRTPCARPDSTRSSSRWPTSATRRAGCTPRSRRRPRRRPRNWSR